MFEHSTTARYKTTTTSLQSAVPLSHHERMLAGEPPMTRVTQNSSRWPIARGMIAASTGLDKPAYLVDCLLEHS